MKISSSSLLLFALVIIPVTAWGRLGETLDECISRYGQPINHDSEDAFNAILATRTPTAATFDKASIAALADQIRFLKETPRGVAVAEAAGANHPSHAVGDFYIFKKSMPAKSPRLDGQDTTMEVTIWATVVDGTVQRMKYQTVLLTGFSSAVQESLLSLNGWVGLPDQEELNTDLSADAEKNEITVERKQLKEKEDAAEDSASKSKALKATEGF